MQEAGVEIFHVGQVEAVDGILCMRHVRNIKQAAANISFFAVPIWQG
jgi:hypothetical protein